MTFSNIPPTDFTIQTERELFANAIQKFQKRISKSTIEVKPIVSGKELKTENHFQRLSPNGIDDIISNVHYANIEQANTALGQLSKFQKTWHKEKLSNKAKILRRTAELMDEQRHDLSAIIVFESGKNWYEADRDVVEAIDFCNYYAEEAETKLASFPICNLPGETNLYTYEPYGTAVIISPWNFPLAIPCGMLVAALVGGNVAVLKPAEQSSLIAYKLVELLFEAGLPPESLTFLPGLGHEIGPVLVESSQTQLICFTGSLAVGKDILQRASNLTQDHSYVKKTILELGGKNAIIVDEDANLDQTIKGTLYSAFAYSGQKCSACSRIIVVGDAIQKFLDRFVTATADLIIAPSYKPESFIGPVIDNEAQNRILNTIQEAEQNTEILFKSDCPEKGNFVPACIVNEPEIDSNIWSQEIFGPVVAIKHVKTIEEAVSLLNNSKFALTGGLYSRSPENIKYAQENARVGNFYINRSCTGAIVGRQPFGGFKLSGIGSKAGGPDYIKQFVVPKVICENTMRRGFTPELDQ